jgi:hypothetical protein
MNFAMMVFLARETSSCGSMNSCQSAESLSTSYHTSRGRR